jgi:hypothetical protein
MYETKELEYKVINFENMQEIENYIKKEDLSKYSLLKEIENEPKFYGTNDFEKTLMRMKYGNKNVTEQYLNGINEIKQEAETNEGYFMDIEGFAYDMGSVVAGEPECCINQGALSNKPYLKIFIDTGYCGGTSQKIINNRGIAIYMLISTLIAKGYILDIYFVHYITAWSTPNMYYAQNVRLPLENIDISQIAFLGTCEYFRTITWLLTAIQSNCTWYTGDGKSMPSDRIVEKLKKEGLFIPSGYTDERFEDCSQEDAIRYITEIYNEGVKNAN